MAQRNKKKKVKESEVEKILTHKEINYNENFINKFINNNALKILIFLIFVIVFIALRKYLLLDYLLFFKDIGSDSLNIDLPSKLHSLRLYKEEIFRDYSFYVGMGESNLLTYPVEPFGALSFLINRIGYSLFGPNFSIYYTFINHFIFVFLLSGIFFYLYLRTISVNKAISIIGSLLVVFSGFVMVGLGWGFDVHVFIGVFLLFAYEQLYVKKRWYFFPFAIIYLSGNLFLIFVYGVFLFLYSLLRHFSIKENKIKDYLQLVGKIIVLGTIGLLMNFATIGKIFLKMLFSPRGTGNASYSEVLSSSEAIVDNSDLGATTILRFFSSDILGCGNNFQGWNNYFEAPLFYIGLLSLLIFPQIFIFLNKRQKIVFGSFFGFWMLTLFVPYLRHAILLFTGDYFRFGFDFFIPFTFLFFSIYALNEIDKQFKINLAILIGTFAVLAVLLFFPYKSLPEGAINSTIQKVAIFLLLIYGYLIYLFSKPQFKKFAQIGLIILIVFELSYFSYNSYKDRVPLTKKEYKENKGGYDDGTIDAVNYLKSIDNSNFYRTEKDYQSGNAIHGSLNDAQAQGYYGTTNYSSFNQLNYIRFMEEIEIIQKGDESATRWSRGFREYPLLQTFANVKYHLSKSKNPYFQNLGFDSIATIEGIKILKNRYYLPFGYTYDKYIDFEDFTKLIYYKITEQTLNNINIELSRMLDQNTTNSIITTLNSISNQEFEERADFISTLRSIFGKNVSNDLLRIIIKHSANNFKSQTVLLNGFVYEDDGNTYFEPNYLTKINISDSSMYFDSDNFTFDKYKEFTDNLKIDTFQITEFHQSKIKGTIDLDKEKMLFFTIPFDKAWNIKINGKEEQLSRVNIGFSGILLSAGNHEIELYYIPQYSQITSVITYMSVAGFWIYLIFYFYRRKKSKNITNEN